MLSTDPAHSLGDALGRRLSSRPARVPGVRGTLAALELNGPRTFARWLSANRQALGDVLEHGTWLDRDDVNALLELSIPGVDELMALVEIARLAGQPAARAAYDLVIVDTAPTGHTLRLLAAPGTVEAVAGVLDDLQQEHRLIRGRFGRAGRPEAADRLIETIARQAREAGALLRDADRSRFFLVALPEALAVAETGDALAALARARIPVAGVIVNRVTPPGPRCPLCDPRRAAESAAIARLRRLAGDRPVREIPARVVEPRGPGPLAAIGGELTAKRDRPGPTRRSAAAIAPVGHRAGAAGAAAALPPERRGAFVGAELLLFGGKGGVGKTTCAAATAIRLAAASPAAAVLLLSTDPAHSLGDVLRTTLDDRARPVPGAPPNLRARELDAAGALAAHRGDIEAALDEIADSAGVAAAGSRGVTQVLDLAPPGIDELLGMLSVVESLGLEHEGRRFDLVVCDTAPTGHALRLLEMPDAAREWVQTLLRVLLKYREMVRPGRLARELVELSQAIRRFQAFLHDPRRSRFVLVTRAAEVPRLESERLMARLRALSIAVPAVIVNAATIEPGGCRRCRAVAAGERAAIRPLATRCRPPACVIIQTPLAAPPPRGAGPLRAWAARWV